MKTRILILAALFTSLAAWSDPAPTQTPVPPTSGLTQATPAATLVKAPAPQPEKKPAEIPFRDFRTARDPYPSR